MLNDFVIEFQIAKLTLDFIIDANLSFNIATTPSLCVLLETVAGRKLDVPTRYKIMTTLDSEYEKMKTCLKEWLEKQIYLCVTADAWTSHAQSYLGVTVHFIDEAFNRRSYLLAFKQMKYRQTYDILGKTVDAIFHDFGITHSQITNIVTDGGSAFCKMFKKYGDQIDAIVIDTNADDDDGEIDGEIDDFPEGSSEEDVVISQSSMIDEHGNEFVSEIITLDSEANGPSTTTEGVDDDEINSYFEGPFIPEEPQIKMPPQRRCVSHILNLIGKAFERNLDGVAKTAYKITFNSLHSLWSIIRNSAFAKTICKEILGVILIFPTETRWNSRFDCIKQCNRYNINNAICHFVCFKYFLKKYSYFDVFFWFNLSSYSISSTKI